MNRVLIWGLAATCALSAWALSSTPGSNGTSQDGGVVPPVTRNAAGKLSTVSAALAPTELPSEWPKPEMDAAARSPFASPSPPLPKAPVQPPAVTSTPPPPPPPPASYRFWGRMSSPERHTTVFLAKGQDGVPIAVQAGTHLEDGWNVDAISDNAIVLANAATQQRTTIFVPPADMAAR
jgi:hypothetical protein